MRVGVGVGVGGGDRVGFNIACSSRIQSLESNLRPLPPLQRERETTGSCDGHRRLSVDSVLVASAMIGQKHLKSDNAPV